MLTLPLIERVLATVPRLRVGVLGDLFLDRYLDLDASLTEPSIETGLDAYQVTNVRSYPGAAGTVVSNLAALGVGSILPFAVIGDDGEGYELRQALARVPAVNPSGVIMDASRRTPTYTKPMLHAGGQPPRELNRLDIKNRRPLDRHSEERLLEKLDAVWPTLDVVLVLDQVSEAECGVVTSRVRERLQHLANALPERVILADSRERIGLFRGLWLKPNGRESRQATGMDDDRSAAVRLSAMCGRPVFCTRGEAGILVVDPRGTAAEGEFRVAEAPAYPVSGPIDVVGAGDSTSAALACGLATGLSLTEAAAFGNLVASITIQQIGVTGTASPAQVRQRWREAGHEPEA